MGIDFRRPRHIRGFRLGEVLVWDFMSKPLVEKTVSGSVVAFFDGADAVLLKSCAVTIVPNLDGVSSVDVVQTGKNLIDWVVSATAFEFILPSGTYTFSVPSGSTIESGNWYFRGFDENGNPYTSRDSLGLSRTWIHATGSHWNYSAPTLYRFTFTIPEGCSKLEIFKQNENGNIPAMIEYGSTSTDYEPYVTPTTHTANLGRTIYGGTVDVVNGTGTDTHKIYTGADVTGLYWNNRKVDQVDINHRATFRIATTSGYIKNTNSLCNELTYNLNIASGSGYTEGYQLVPTGGIYFCIDLADIGMSSATSDTPNQDFLDAIHEYGDNLKFAVELSAPTDFTFTPTPIISRLGDNTMWGDGDLEVTYYAYAD